MKNKKNQKYFQENNIKYKDLGPYTYDSEDDYPTYIIPAAEEVSKNKNSLGIIIGGSGQGEAIAANKVKGIRAVVLNSFNKNIIALSKQHNNANMISLGARFLSEKEAIRAVYLWLKTPFSGEMRHMRRIKKISDYEKKEN